MNAITARSVRYAAIIGALGLLFAWFGVYDTGRLPFPARFAYWAASIGVGVLSSIWLMPEVFERRFPNQHVLVKIAIAATAVSIPVTVALLGINYYAFGDSIADTNWATQFAYVLVVSLVLTAGFAFAELFERTIATRAADGPNPAAPAFVDRLPARLRTAHIYAVSAEDHYLRVHTSAGEELILMRLGDAIRELEGIEGLQIHRSWWVAREGLAESERVNGKLVLKLKSGAAAPVSRTYRKSIETAGWL